MTAPLRRLDLGVVSPLRSQAIYHGLAAAMDATTPDTVVFCRPRAPYFCVGYHQSAEDVLDLPRCRRAGWPVLRRKIGGGAVYLDETQLFYQVVVHRSRAPFAVGEIYRTYLAAPVLALRRLGLAAALRGVNEIEVGARRIAGTGGGQLGDAVVVVGNVLFDFPHARMTRAWKAPSASFRRLAGDGLRRYLTTLRAELAEVPAMEAVAELLAQCYAATLARPMVPGCLTAREEAAITAAGAALVSEAFVPERMPRPRAGLKIARGVYVAETEVAGAPGPVRLTARVRDGVLDAVAMTPGVRNRRVPELVGTRLEPRMLWARLGGAPHDTGLVEALLALGRVSAEVG